jgi:translation initiation factor 1 (eIF-1/SUI1)
MTTTISFVRLTARRLRFIPASSRSPPRAVRHARPSRRARTMNQTGAAFVVNGTKKGAFPARVETRKFGKKVTVLDNCAGDLDALVSHVKKKLGCGGHVSSRSTVELATSDIDRVHRTLSAAKALRGVTGEGTSAAKRKEKADASKAIDSLGAQTRRETPRAKPRHDATRRAATASRGDVTVVVAGEPKTSASSFDGYKSLMQTWPYWDGHAYELVDMFARRKREHEAEIAGAMFEGCGGDESAERRDAARDADSRPVVSAESALRALGMIAEPSAFRQSRLERQREAALAKKAAKAQSSTQTNGSSTSTTAPRLGAATDPFADYLRDEAGFAPAISAHTRANTASVASSSTTSRPSSSRVATSRASRGPARLAKASRPTGGSYASARKAWTRFDAERDDSEDASSDDADDAPAWRRAGFDVGFTKDSSGKFSFGGVERAPSPPNRSVAVAPSRTAGSRRARVRGDSSRIDDSPALWPTPSATADAVEAREAEELAEAIRLSKLDYEASPASRRMMHIECGDLYAGMTEDEILALVVAASRAEMDAADASREADAPSSTRRADDSVPTKSRWVHERLGELFFPDVDVAKTVADVFFAASEYDRDFTLDLLVGAGAPLDEADAFCDLYASLTLED